jgi:hypothetical protein
MPLFFTSVRRLLYSYRKSSRSLPFRYRFGSVASGASAVEQHHNVRIVGLGSQTSNLHVVAHVPSVAETGIVLAAAAVRPRDRHRQSASDERYVGYRQAILAIAQIDRIAAGGWVPVVIVGTRNRWNIGVREHKYILGHVGEVRRSAALGKVQIEKVLYPPAVQKIPGV